MREPNAAAVPAGIRSPARRRFPNPPAPGESGEIVHRVRAMNEEVVLAFDFGARRIGVAIGNTLTRSARALAVLQDAPAWNEITALLNEWQPARLVVGVPRHPDGAPHEMTARCERFARQLEGRFRLPVARVDERYSTVVAAGGRDDEAAAVILQQWLDALGPEAAS